jgi:hypothetical protein
MNMKLLAESAAIATGVGLSVLTSAAGLVHADPSNPSPPCLFNCPTGPGGPGSSPQDNPLRPGYPGIRVPGSPAVIIPPVGGGPKSGGRSVQQPGVTVATPAGD